MWLSIYLDGKLENVAMVVDGVSSKLLFRAECPASRENKREVCNLAHNSGERAALLS
jgi:hypothetical protein